MIAASVVEIVMASGIIVLCLIDFAIVVALVYLFKQLKRMHTPPECKSEKLGFDPVDLSVNDAIDKFSAKSREMIKSQKPYGFICEEARDIYLAARDAAMSLAEAYDRFGGYDQKQIDKLASDIDSVLPYITSGHILHVSEVSRYRYMIENLRTDLERYKQQ